MTLVLFYINGPQLGPLSAMSNVVAEGRLGPLVENTAAWNELKSELSETPASQAISSNELRALLEKLGAVSKKPRLVERAMELAYALSTEGVETYADLTSTVMKSDIIRKLEKDKQDGGSPTIGEVAKKTEEKDWFERED